VGLERLISGSEMPFVERALPTALAPNRDVGLVVFGDVVKGTVNYTVGVQNGVVDAASADLDDRDGKDVVARAFVLPFRNGSRHALKQLGFGLAGTSGSQRGSLLSPNLPIYRTSGQAVFARYRLDTALTGTTIADGRHWRISPQGYYYTGPFGVLGEYIRSSQAVRRADTTSDLASSAWQIAGSWVLTGEDSSYRGVTPRAIFDPSQHTWGALELTTRYNALALDRDAFPTFANPAAAARTARAWALGTNWYLNRAVKVTVDFEETRFEGGATSGDRPTERNVLTRFQFGY
jgi:phosphate-selective porin OprO/OprP